jgi:hypothetical protein
MGGPECRIERGPSPGIASPAGGDRELGLLLARLEDDPDDPIGARIQAANATAVERLLGARPMLVDVRPADRELVLAEVEGRVASDGGRRTAEARSRRDLAGRWTADGAP